MLQVYTEQGWLPITNIKDYYTDYEYGGEEALHFSISPQDEIYKQLNEECNIKNEENMYTLKKRNKLKTLVSYDCELNMDDWKSSIPYKSTKDELKFQTKSLSQILESIKPEGWKIVNATITDIKRTPELECVNDYGVLMNLMELFSVVYRINTLTKTLEIVNADDMQDKGLYITKELNLESDIVKGDSSQFITRLYCEGKEGLTFADINGGKDYVDCFEYSSKIITARWKDERYTVKEQFLEDAKKKLKKLAIPSMSYTIAFKDLARCNETYDFLNFGLYDLAHVLLESGIEIIQKVVKYRKYHNETSKSILTLSTEPQKINVKLQQVNNAINDDGTTFQGSIVQQAQLLATAMLTNALGGYVIKTRNELFIMDTDNPNSSKKVWRWNLNGLGYSPNGINGPYTTAITADGKIVADAITAGVLRAINIEGTTIRGSTISGNSISGGSINGTTITNGSNFNVDAQGNMTAKNAKFSGDVVGGTITGDTTINVGTDLSVGNNIYLGEQNPNSTSIKYLYLSSDMFIRRFKQASGGGSITVENDSPVGAVFIRNKSSLHISELDCNVNSVGLSVKDSNFSLLNDFQLRTDGTFSKYAITVSSDKRLKENIHSIDLTGLLDCFEVKGFNYIGNSHETAGVIAQSFINTPYEKLILNKNNDGYYTVDYNIINMALVQKIKKQDSIINTILKQIKDTKKEGV